MSLGWMTARARFVSFNLFQTWEASSSAAGLVASTNSIPFVSKHCNAAVRFAGGGSGCAWDELKSNTSVVSARKIIVFSLIEYPRSILRNYREIIVCRSMLESTFEIFLDKDLLTMRAFGRILFFRQRLAASSASSLKK